MYAFLHIEKTAGSALNTILRRSFGARHCDIRLPLAKRRAKHYFYRGCVEAVDLRRVRRLYRNLAGIAGHNVRPIADLEAECREIRFFTFLRDPTARLRSHFLNRAKSHARDDFYRWISSPRVRNWQTVRIAGEPDAEKAIELLTARFGFVGLTEQFDESLVMLGQWLDEPAFRGQYRRVNQLSDKRRAKDFARQRLDMEYLDSDRARLALAVANEEDQKLYDHVVSNVYPRQRAAFRGVLAAEVRKFQETNPGAGRLTEPISGRFMRNYVYKPLLHFGMM
jgi:hypothetical protein